MRLPGPTTASKTRTSRFCRLLPGARMHPIALVCVSALGLLLFGLGACVSGLRFRSKRLSSHAVEPDSLLHRVVRAHGNSAEFIPLLAVLILYLGAGRPPAWVMACAVGATLSRFLLVAGLVFPASMAKPNALRFIGALGTYCFGAALCIALLPGA